MSVKRRFEASSVDQLPSLRRRYGSAPGPYPGGPSSTSPQLHFADQANPVEAPR